MTAFSDRAASSLNTNLAHSLDWIDTQLPAARAELLSLSNVNSGSFNVQGVDACGDRMREWFAPLGGEAETIEVAPFRSTDDRGELRERSLGHALRIRKRPDAPLKIFLCGHLDTVFDAAHPFQTARVVDEDTLNGPGVADLKGGLMVMQLVLAALEASPNAAQIGWEVLMNPDEEIGSQSSAALLNAAAKRNHFGLIFEPAYADGGLASSRKGSGNFDIIVRGRAAHAGRNPQDGRNAIALASEMAVQLHSLNQPEAGLTINVGYLHGGGALNIVPDLCILKFNVRTESHNDELRLLDAVNMMLGTANARDGYALELRGGFTRPPKPVSEGTARLQSLLHASGQQLGIDLSFRPTGGCCDGNNLHAAGLPNVDNLGVIGGEIHSEREWMRVSSIAERAKLSALMLLRLASGESQWC